MRKKIIVFFAALAVALGLLPDKLWVVHGTSTLKVGDYVYFGAANNQPVLWRVINNNADNSYMLFSEYVLFQKAFDASGDKTDGRDSRDGDRVKEGSNNWEKSNMREWLNSKDAEVKYSHKAPSLNSVVYYRAGEEKMPGFLYEFTEAERNAIQPYKNKSLLAEVDKSVKDGGTQAHTAKSDNYRLPVSNAVQNFDKSYYKNLTDKVFLLDVKELHDYVYKRGWKISRSWWKPNENYEVDSQGYWLRTPMAGNGCSVRVVRSGDVDGNMAQYGNVGVVPALNIKSGTGVVSGEGSLEKPYILSTAPKYISMDIGKNIRILQKGKADKIKAVTEPSDLKFTYLSSNPKAATVSGDGIITGLNPGITVITIKSNLSGYKESVQKIDLTVIPSNLSYVITPEDFEGKFMVWNGKNFMSIEETGNNTYTSADGISWGKSGIILSSQHPEYAEAVKEPWAYTRQLWEGLIYQKNIYLATAFSQNSNDGIVLYSKDGSKWQDSLKLPSGTGTTSFTKSCYMNNTFFVFGITGFPVNKLVVYSSKDGLKWSKNQQSFPGFVESAAYNGKRYVASNTYKSLIVSEDGKKWTKLDMGKMIKFKDIGMINGLASNGKGFISTTSSGTVMASSDGKQWSKVMDKDLLITAAEWTGSQYVLAAYDEAQDNGCIFVSKTGSDWKQIMLGKNIYPQEIYWNNSKIFIRSTSEDIIYQMPQ